MLVVVVRRVDVRAIEVQVVRVVSIVRCTRPIVAVAALIVGTAAVPVARQDEAHCLYFWSFKPHVFSSYEPTHTSKYNERCLFFSLLPLGDGESRFFI